MMYHRLCNGRPIKIQIQINKSQLKEAVVAIPYAVEDDVYWNAERVAVTPKWTVH
jgi:hypothetical protein